LLAGPGGRPPEQVIRHLMPVPWPLGPVTDQSTQPRSWYTGKVTRVNPNDEVLAALREKHPEWQIWRVDRYLGGPLWCARPLGQTQPVLNAARPGRLSELIEAKEAGL